MKPAVHQDSLIRARSTACLRPLAGWLSSTQQLERTASHPRGEAPAHSEDDPRSPRLVRPVGSSCCRAPQLQLTHVSHLTSHVTRLMSHVSRVRPLASPVRVTDIAAPFPPEDPAVWRARPQIFTEQISSCHADFSLQATSSEIAILTISLTNLY